MPFSLAFEMGNCIFKLTPSPIEDIHFFCLPHFPHIFSEFVASPVEFPQIF